MSRADSVTWDADLVLGDRPRTANNEEQDATERVRSNTMTSSGEIDLKNVVQVAISSSPTSPEISPLERNGRTSSQARIGLLPSRSKTSRRVNVFRPRQYHRWKSPLLMALYLLIGMVMSIGHCIFYSQLNGDIVGDQSDQENKIR